MLQEAPATPFSRLSPWQARSVLGLFVLGMIFCLAVSLSPIRNDHRHHNLPGEGDLALYKAEANRVRAGEGYYSAIASELRARGYPTRSVFNWRCPLPVWLFGALPQYLAQSLLCAAALAVMYLGLRMLDREAGTLACLIGMPLLFGAVSACFVPQLAYLSELWAGVFIALSILAYANEHRRLGVVAGLAAQFLRELSAVYTIVAIGLAIRDRRWREVAAWLVGLAVYAVYLGRHFTIVHAMIRPDDLAHAQGWVRFGAAPFVISTAHLNSILLVWPQWIAAVYFALALLGFAAWNSPAGTRIALTMCLFLVAFSVVGQSFNQYWGAIYAPLFCLGAAKAPAALRDLWRASRPGAIPVGATPSAQPTA
jgi:hypothetical protein